VAQFKICLDSLFSRRSSFKLQAQSFSLNLRTETLSNKVPSAMLTKEIIRHRFNKKIWALNLILLKKVNQKEPKKTWGIKNHFARLLTNTLLSNTSNLAVTLFRQNKRKAKSSISRKFSEPKEPFKLFLM